jgi:flavorubredoxin
MWQSTALMARAICGGLVSEGVSVKVMPLESSHRSDVATEILDAGALLVGSPTLNNNIFPTLADALTYLKGLKPKNLLGAVFGSYGWSGESVKQLREFLTEMKVELVGEGINVKYVPDDEALAQCFSLGVLVAQKLKEKYPV